MVLIITINLLGTCLQTKKKYIHNAKIEIEWSPLILKRGGNNMRLLIIMLYNKNIVYKDKLT